MSVKGALSIAQYFSKILGRPVGRGESATKVQQEALEKLNRAGARSISKPIKSLPTDSKIMKRKIDSFNKSVKAGKPVIDERLEEMLKRAAATDPAILKPVPRKKKSTRASRRKRPKSIFLTGGQAKIDKNKNDRIDAEDFKILREENNMKDGGVTSAIKKIRGIGMAKGGFKKKTPIY